jgi:hypothetical protein
LPKKAEAKVAGDLVLFEDEVNPVMSAAALRLGLRRQSAAATALWIVPGRL